jgi:hypothetical protein
MAAVRNIKGLPQRWQQQQWIKQAQTQQRRRPTQQHISARRHSVHCHSITKPAGDSKRQHLQHTQINYRDKPVVQQVQFGANKPQMQPAPGTQPAAAEQQQRTKPQPWMQHDRSLPLQSESATAVSSAM